MALWHVSFMQTCLWTCRFPPTPRFVLSVSTRKEIQNKNGDTNFLNIHLWLILWKYNSLRYKTNMVVNTYSYLSNMLSLLLLVILISINMCISVYFDVLTTFFMTRNGNYLFPNTPPPPCQFPFWVINDMTLVIFINIAYHINTTTLYNPLDTISTEFLQTIIKFSDRISYMAFGLHWCFQIYCSPSCSASWLSPGTWGSCCNRVCGCSGISCCHSEFPSCSGHSRGRVPVGWSCHEPRRQNCKRQINIWKQESSTPLPISSFYR